MSGGRFDVVLGQQDQGEEREGGGRTRTDGSDSLCLPATAPRQGRSSECSAGRFTWVHSFTLGRPLTKNHAEKGGLGSMVPSVTKRPAE